MSVRLHAPATCTTCGAALTVGSKVDRGTHGRGYQHTHNDRLTGRCVARAAAAAEPAERRATDRQVAYAWDLQVAYWTPAVFGGRRYSRDDLAALSRDEVSRVIDTLRSECVEQEG